MSLIDEETFQQFLSKLLSDEVALAKLRKKLFENDFVSRKDFYALLEEIKALRIDTRERFEAMDKRFEAVDKRFEDMNKRFEAMDKRFEALREDMNMRFEAVLKELDSRTRYLSTQINTIGGRTGLAIEKAIIKILRELLVKEGISPEKIRIVEKLGIRDVEGKFLYPNAKIEIDGYIDNDRPIIMEIKFKPSKQDVQIFYKKAEAFEYYKKKKPEKWLLAVDITEYVKALAEELGMKVIALNIVPPIY